MKKSQKNSSTKKSGLVRDSDDSEIFFRSKSGEVREFPPKDKIRDKKEIRVLICKECQCEIDEMGCSYDCKYAILIESKRNPKTLEFWTYSYLLNKIEEYKR